MDIPNVLPIIYSTSILIPSFTVRIELEAQKNADLLNHIHQNDNIPELNLVGVIPEIDYGKVDNVIGSVGYVKNSIQFNPGSNVIVLIVHGLCRFKLDKPIFNGPLKQKIIPIANFKELLGDEKEKKKLKAEFEKELYNLITVNETIKINSLNKEIIKTHLKQRPLNISVEYCLKHLIKLTPADVYKILIATNLNNIVKYTTEWLKQESIKENQFSKVVKIPSGIFTNVSVNQSNGFKKRISPELSGLQKTIEKSNMPKPVYDSIMKYLNRLLEMYTGNPDYSVLINYVNYVVKLPWNKSTNETLDLEKAKHVLQLNHYGMDKVKKRILQFIAVRILNPERRGPILCFIGPPGVGKTTIAKAVAESLNRKFIRISLGGINHFSDIKGHRKTYVGAMPGKIIQAITQANTINPIILLDEIDKMYKGSAGDPAAALLEVLDPEQNNSFVDTYINLPFDLSQVMFISTANNAAYIPQTLRDRMEIIYLEGYTLGEKTEIAEKYLIPKILKDHKMDEVKIIINKNTIINIIQNYTSEAGIRELQRKLEEICHYIAVKIVENADNKLKNYVITPECLLNIFDSEYYGIKNTLVDKLKCCDQIGVAIGLSWTPVGGKVQVIETSRLYSRNETKRLILTGLVGQTLQESVEIALNWIQSFSKKNALNIDNFCVHVHFPEGGHKKDGPSAGITVACALISLFWNVVLRPMIAMTGELSLQGYVLPVGGVKEKILAAFNSDIKTIIIPEPNLKDIQSLPENVKEEVNIIPVTHLMEVLDVVVPGGLAFLQKPTISMLIPRSKI